MIPSDVAGLQVSEFKSKLLNSLLDILLPQKNTLPGGCAVLENQLKIIRAKVALGATAAGVVAEHAL